jgi:hypothetical protein
MSGVRCIVALFAIAALVPVPAAAQADPNKVLRVAFPVAETGFDPQAANDLYSNHVNRAIFDTPYTYDYLARPYSLWPTPRLRFRKYPPMAARGRSRSSRESLSAMIRCSRGKNAN